MMKLRILLLNLLVVYTIHFMAQESYSNDVTCMKADDNIAVITASGTAEKKKDVYNMALKSIFSTALTEWKTDSRSSGKKILTI